MMLHPPAKKSIDLGRPPSPLHPHFNVDLLLFRPLRLSTKPRCETHPTLHWGEGGFVFRVVFFSCRVSVFLLAVSHADYNDICARTCVCNQHCSAGMGCEVNTFFCGAVSVFGILTGCAPTTSSSLSVLGILTGCEPTTSSSLRVCVQLNFGRSYIPSCLRDRNSMLRKSARVIISFVMEVSAKASSPGLGNL